MFKYAFPFLILFAPIGSLISCSSTGAIADTAAVYSGITVLREEPDAAAPDRAMVYRVSSDSINKNRIGDPIKPVITIYFPASYQKTNKRYPVVYYLQGFGSYRDQNVSDWINALDQVFSKNPGKEFIFVSIPGGNKYGGSMYLNSDATGYWEDFVVKEIVMWVDSQFRTVSDRAARGIFGFSMGADGALSIGFKYPEVFSRVFALSGLIASEEDINPHALDAMNKQMAFALLSAAAPAMDQPAPFVWYPEFSGDDEDTKIIQTLKNSIVWNYERLRKYEQNKTHLNALCISCGDQDGNLQSNRNLDILLQQAGIPHTFTTFDGGHGIGQEERIQEIVPFFLDLSSARAVKKSGHTNP